jgi:hypothetical protein
MYYAITKILKKKSESHPRLCLPADAIKLMSRLLPKLQEANADYANDGRGALGPAAAARVHMHDNDQTMQAARVAP